jgi:hypothetical protein
MLLKEKIKFCKGLSQRKGQNSTMSAQQATPYNSPFGKAARMAGSHPPGDLAISNANISPVSTIMNTPGIRISMAIAQASACSKAVCQDFSRKNLIKV